MGFVRWRGFETGTVIDIGAFKGKFARMVRSWFPDAGAIMFETNIEFHEMEYWTVQAAEWDALTEKQ